MIKMDELMLQNQMEEALPDLGIEVSLDLMEYNLNKAEYVKIDAATAGRVNAVLQQLPLLINNTIYDGDVYRVIYDKGLGVLQKSAKYHGMFLGNVVDSNTNNKIKDVAKLQELSNKSQQIAINIFSVMSMVTGQYFMSQISQELDGLNENVKYIRKFLENDKRSKLQSEEEFLKMTQKTINFILQDEAQKQATLSSIQKIRIDALSGIYFYKMQINDLRDLSLQKDKAKKLIKNIQKICFVISEYWYSLYLYCYALYLETIISENYDSEYIKMMIQDMMEKCDQYKADYSKWKRIMENYIDEAKAFGANKGLEATKHIRFRGGGNIYVLVIGAAFDTMIEVADRIDKKSKKKKQDDAKEHLNLNEIAEDMKAIECRQNELRLYDALYNDRLEIVKDHDELYMKIPKKIVKEVI